MTPHHPGIPGRAAMFPGSNPYAPGPGGGAGAAQSAAAAAAAAAHAARDMPWSAAANLAAPGPAALPSSAYNQAYYAALHANMASAAQAQLAAAAMAPPPQPPPPAVVTSGMSSPGIRTRMDDRC